MPHRPSTERSVAEYLRVAADNLRVAADTPHPGTILAKYVKPRNNKGGSKRLATVTDIATINGSSRDLIYKVLAGQRPITQQLADDLEYLGIGAAKKWVAAQKKYDAENAGIEKYYRAADRLDKQTRATEALLREANELATQKFS